MMTRQTDKMYQSELLIDTSPGNILITLPEVFRDKEWIHKIGEIQTGIEDLNSKGSSGVLCIDFKSTRWVDPFPLISLLLEIKNAQTLGLKIELLFPVPDSGPLQTETGPYQASPNRLLRFLAREGFLGSLEELSREGNITLSPPESQNWREYRELIVTASYEDAHCIPIAVISAPPSGLDSQDFAKEIVDEKLVGLNAKLQSRIAPHLLERLTYKLRITLQELLTNSQEHAYDIKATDRVVGLYVRYRSGKIGLDSTVKPTYKNAVEEESLHCSRLDRSWLDTRPGCLEVFILDRGVGIVKNFEKSQKTAGWKRWKFAEALHATFYKGESTKEKRQTKYGGLHLIHNILKTTGDYIRAVEGKLWFGSGIPLARSGAQNREVVDCRNPFKGLGFHLRLGWKEDTDTTDRWAKFAQHQKSEIWPELKLDSHDCASSFDWFENQLVIDHRFDEKCEYGKKGDWVLWLVPHHLAKSDITNYLQYKIAPRVKPDTVLIIADIPSYEAETYAETLANFEADTSWPTHFSTIILCTNRLRFAVLTYKEYVYDHYEHGVVKDGFSDLHTNVNNIKFVLPDVFPKPTHIRLFVLRWLKWHDSRIVWNEIEADKSLNKMFIPEEIIWGAKDNGQPQTIAGYLNFTRTTHNRLCSQVYQAALTRVLGVVPPTIISWHSPDRLLTTLLRKVRTFEEFEPGEAAKEKFVIGSVLVSGSTLHASAEHVFNVHLFIHSASQYRGESPSILYWLPKTEIQQVEPRYKRIGRTAAIAIEGWKSFEVPRFDSRGNQVGERSPCQTYQDWQSPSPVIVKSGHWSYEGHHDFITVNIPNAVDAAFLGKTELVRFLSSKILRFLGIGKDNIDPNWYHVLPEDYDEPSSRGGLLIYRSHPSSDIIISYLLSILTESGRERARADIFPIQPVRMRGSGSTFLIPPLEQEDIRRALVRGGRARDVMLFDDAAITGGTLTDLHVKLNALGADPRRMRKVVLINRLRHPSDGHNYPRIEYYWRLDIPVMGRDGSCPLCHALNMADAFSNSLTASNAKKEIAEWKAKWGNTSPSSNWSAGLQPIPIKTPERGKPYCYRISQSKQFTSNSYQAKIDITRSTGRIIHISELYAMTGRDDYSIKKINEHSEPEIKVEIAASQLFIYGNEFDHKIRFELLKSLMTYLAQLKSDSPHASLASLAIIGNFNFLNDKDKNHFASMVIDDNWRKRNNYCTKIILAYFVAEGLLDPNSYPYKVGKSILSTATWPIERRLNDWFLGTKSPRGNSHTEAIPLLIDRITRGSKIRKLEHRDAIDSLDHFLDILEGLERGVVRIDKTADFNKAKEQLESAITEAKTLLCGDSKKCDYNEILIALTNVISEIRTIASALFHIIDSPRFYPKNKTYEKKALADIVNSINWKNALEAKEVPRPKRKNYKIEISVMGEVGFGKFTQEVWILWHRGTTGIIRDLLKNAVYATETIHDPWNKESKNLADLWVKINYTDKHVQMIFANKADPRCRPIFKHLKSERWGHLTEFGGKIEKHQFDDHSLFGIAVQIPYAGHLTKEDTCGV